MRGLFVYLSSGGVFKVVRVGTPSRSIPAQPADCTDSICNQIKKGYNINN